MRQQIYQQAFFMDMGRSYCHASTAWQDCFQFLSRQAEPETYAEVVGSRRVIA